MLQFIYASAASATFSPEDLRMLLAKARSRNTLYSVTGMLLYHNGSFLQVLEGPPTSVGIIFDSIQRTAATAARKPCAAPKLPGASSPNGRWGS